MRNIDYLRMLVPDELEEFLERIYVDGMIANMKNNGWDEFFPTAEWLESEFDEEEFWGGVEQ